MNITKKKIISLISAGAVITSLVTMANAEENKIYINDTVLENAKIVKNAENVDLIPLRAICENLGFEVNWINESRTIEIVKMPVYITCTPDADGYTFARTAPMLLGTAPSLINDTTYVPTNFVDEILKGTITKDNDNYKIIYGEASEEINKPIVEGTVCDLIVTDGKLEKIVIGEIDNPETQTILNLTDEMIEKASELNIEVGTKIIAEVEDLATLSIPPQMIPVSLDVLSEEVSSVDIEGKICELVFENENLVQIVIGEKENPMTQTVLNLSEDVAEKAIELEVAVDKTIKATVSEIATRSIPPQHPVISINEIK